MIVKTDIDCKRQIKVLRSTSFSKVEVFPFCYSEKVGRFLRRILFVNLPNKYFEVLKNVRSISISHRIM